MKKAICLALVAASLAVPAFGELSEQYQGWAEGPVKWLMTEDELSEWKQIDTDEEAQAFIDLFWARRDPSPGTPLNEMKEGYEARIKVADERFTAADTRGALTDRGRVYLLLGAPKRLGRTSNAPQSTHQSGVSLNQVSNARGQKAPSEVWFYEKDNRPPFADELDFEATFIDEYGTNDYKLVVAGGKRSINELLLQAKDYYQFQPDLETVPDYTMGTGVAAPAVEPVAREFVSEALKAAYEEFKSREMQEQDDLHLTFGEFITPTGQYYVPVQLYVPSEAEIDATGEVTFFGVVEEQETGEIVAVYEEPATLYASNLDSYFDKSLIIPPGDYIGTFGLARGEEPIVIAATEMTLEGLTEDEASVSRLIMSNNIFALTEAQDPIDPYAFGGLKVVPKGDDTFSTEEEIWYFFELRNPGLNEEGQPTVRVKLDVEGEKADGEPVKMSAPMMEVNAQPVRDTEGHYMVGSSFPAGAFPPGSYMLKARIFDANAKQTWNLETEFNVVE